MASERTWAVDLYRIRRTIQGYRAKLVIWRLSTNERRSPNGNTPSKIHREIAKETAVREHGFGEQNALTIRMS